MYERSAARLKQSHLFQLWSLHFVVFLFLFVRVPEEVPTAPDILGDELPAAAEFLDDFFFFPGRDGECPERWPAAEAFPPEELEKLGRSSVALNACTNFYSSDFFASSASI